MNHTAKVTHTGPAGLDCTVVLQLRPYQVRTFEALRAGYAAGYRSLLCVSPTGSGKTVLAAEVIRSALVRGNHSLFLAGQTVLIDQTVAKLRLAGIEHVRVIQADRDEGPADAPVTVASVQTLTGARWDGRRPEAKLVILDECDHGPARTWASVMHAYRSARWLGLTAVPERADGKGLGELFERIVLGASVRELIDLGCLARPHVLPPPEGALEDGQIAIDPVAAYQQHANGQRAAVFCLTVEQARRYAAEFNAAGISAEIVTATTRDRSRILQRFAAGEFRALVSIGCLTTGWDDPGCAVAILARKPAHVGLWLQICGRVLRPYPGKAEGLILDLGGAFWDFGPPDLPRDYSLDGKAISSVIKDVLTQCRTCGSAFLAGPRVCPYCAAELPVRPVQLPKVAGIGLVDPGSPAAPKREFVVAMTSKRSGYCESCRGPIARGEEILWATLARTATHRYCRGERVTA